MADQFPTFSDVRERLKQLTPTQLQALAKGSKVPYHTLLKIRSGQTQNPGLVTVHKFWSQIPAIERGWDGSDRRGKARNAASAT